MREENEKMRGWLADVVISNEENTKLKIERDVIHDKINHLKEKIKRKTLILHKGKNFPLIFRLFLT